MSRQSALNFFRAITYVGVYGGLLMPLVFIPVVIFPFVFSKLVCFQILIGVTFPAYLALAWMDQKYRPPKSVLYTAIIAYFCAIGLSVLFSEDIHRSWWGNQERMNGLFTLLHFFMWLTMAVGMLKQWKDWKWLLNYEVVISAIMALVAIMQRINPTLLVFKASDRVGGLLDNPIYMGVYEMFNLAFLALLFLKTNSKTARWWYLGLAVIDVIAFFLTQSRGALFGLGAVIGFFALYYGFFTPSKKARWTILGGAAGVFALYVLAYIFRTAPLIATNPILSRLTNLQASTATRLIAWDIAWKGFLERPLTGWGFDAFHILFNLKYNPVSLEYTYYETWFDRSHNTIMDTLAMTGIFGLITYLAVFVSILVLVWRARKKGWIDLPIAAVLTALPIGYFLQNLFVFDHPAAFSMSYLLFALVIAATRPAFVGAKDDDAAAAVSSSAPSSSHAAPWTGFVVLQVVMLFIVWQYSVQPFRASRMAIQANNDLSSGQVDAGFKLMKQANEISNLYNGETSFLMTRDLISLIEGGQLSKDPNWREKVDFAIQLNEDYLAKHPKDTNSIFVYARFMQVIFPLLPQDQMSAAAAKSEELYVRALKTSPKRQQLHYGLARLYAQVGQIEKARDELKKAVDDNPNVGESWWYYGLITWMDLKQEDEGTKAVLQSVKAKVPYAITSVQALAQVARAAQIQKDTDALKWIMERMQSPEVSGGSVALYLEIARAMEATGMMEERNKILNALLQVDSTLEAQLAALSEGRVQTIDESIALAPKSTSTEPVPTAPTSTTDASAATSSANAEPVVVVASASVPGATKGPRK
ncbi:MAG: O-antigen ligase family protein [Candidatus Uhrbacteria bacterium]|nr:O-antigen ligase family protein [Candidatus Uhrbacteria bacterium]